jgi:hypothetical protein
VVQTNIHALAAAVKSEAAPLHPWLHRHLLQNPSRVAAEHEVAPMV